MKKINLFVFALLAVLLVASFTYAWSWPWQKNNPQLGPGNRTIVNANECRADGVCETKTLTSNLITMSRNDEGGTLNVSINSRNLFFTKQLPYISVSAIYDIQGFSYEDSNGDYASLGPGGFGAKYLSGNGTAYACLSASGALFRSLTPCR